MNKRTKLFLGIMILLLGIFKLSNMIMPTYLIPYIFNYQVLLLIVGIYLIFKKGIDNVTGIFFIIIAIYLYIQEYLMYEYIEIIMPVILIISGLFIIFKYITDNKEK